MFGAELVKAVGAEALWAKTQDGTMGTWLSDAANAARAGGWTKAMQPLRGQKIITYHRSWLYLANRFGMSVSGELEPKPGVPPTAAHLTELAENAKSDGVKIILQEPFYSTKAANQLAERSGALVVVVANSVGGQPEAGDYLTLLDLIVGKLAQK